MLRVKKEVCKRDDTYIEENFKTSPCLQTFMPESYDISSLNYVFCFLCFCETSSSRNKESGVVFPQFNQKRSPEELVYGAAMLVVMTDSD